ncbi:hypothetical protein BKA56DRAFT_307909 [Ilyonectria sp. MPI-CAGE-AT-0026]|nr:hypothetical protein BKA56DRAFT_307909 [Ilyonectria sp. MPI-CAGE-AT-0026]
MLSSISSMDLRLAFSSRPHAGSIAKAKSSVSMEVVVCALANEKYSQLTSHHCHVRSVLFSYTTSLVVVSGTAHCLGIRNHKPSSNLPATV